MRDLSAKNFGIAGIFIILLLLATLMLVGLMTYLAWHDQNPWPTSTQPKSGKMLVPPASRKPTYAPAILYGEPPVPSANRSVETL